MSTPGDQSESGRWRAQRLPMAIEALASGRLPADKPHRVFGGAGSGKSCDLCGEFIPAAQVEIEAEFAQPSDAAGRVTYRSLTFHVPCFEALERMRARAQGTHS